MSNYSSLSFHLDKIFEVIIKGREEWGVQDEEVFSWREVLGCEKVLCMKRKSISFQEKKKSGYKVSVKFPRVLT